MTRQLIPVIRLVTQILSKYSQWKACQVHQGIQREYQINKINIVFNSVFSSINLANYQSLAISFTKILSIKYVLKITSKYILLIYLFYFISII